MITQEYAFTHKDEYAVLSINSTKNTIITVDILEDPNNFPSLIQANLLNLQGCLTIGQVLNYSKLVVDCESLAPLTIDKINTFKQKRTYYQEDTNQTIEYITLPESEDQEGGIYEIADPTWRSSPAHSIKQADIIHWHRMQDLTITSADIGVKVAPLDDFKTIPANFLPSYIDDVIEGYLNEQDNNFYKDEYFQGEPIPGKRNKIYIDLKSNKSYRYTPNAYIVISGVIDTSLLEEAIENAQDNIQNLQAEISNLPTTEDIQTIIEENSGIGCTLQQVTVSSIAVSANDNYAFSIKETIPSIEGYIPLSIAGYHLSAGEVSLNKLYINEGDIEAAGTVLLNGESSFDMIFDIYYVLDTKFIPQENESEF